LTRATHQRAAGAAGAAFVLLLNLALFLPGAPPRGNESAADIASGLASHRGAVLGGIFIAAVAAVCGVWFFCAVRTWLGDAAPDADPSFGGAAVAGALLAIGLILVGMLLFYGATYEVAGRGSLGTVRGLTDAGNASIEISKFGTALFVIGVLAAGASVLPRWLRVAGVIAVVLAIVSAIALFSRASFTQFGGGLDLLGGAPSVLWILAISGLLMRRPAA
jgi:hypothetical protein